MERLTKKDKYGHYYTNERIHDRMLGGEPYPHAYDGKVIDKLANYEDKEEQGLLIELPCKVGDTIYKIHSKVNYDLNIINGHSDLNRVYAQKVHSIEMFRNDSYLLNTCEGMSSVHSDFYKETWFLTESEAEEALAKMGGK